MRFKKEMKILLISHGHNEPFLAATSHYSSILKKHGEVTTLYLSGMASESWFFNGRMGILKAL